MTLVAAGRDGYVVSSEDAVTWTTRATSVIGLSDTGWPLHVAALAYSPDLDLYVAAGSFGGGRFSVSQDLETWALLSMPYFVDRVYWASGLGMFIAAYGSAPGDTIVSDDGVTWTPGGRVWSRPPGGSPYYSSIERFYWSESVQRLICISGENGQASHAQIAYSDDGLTWTQIPESAIDKTYAPAYDPKWTFFEDVASSPNGVLMVLASGNGLLRSVDGGQTWASQQSPVTGMASSGPLQTLTWSSDLGVFAAFGRYRSVSSPDGVAWAEHREVRSGYAAIWSPPLQLFVTLDGQYARYRSELGAWDSAQWPYSQSMGREMYSLIEPAPPPPLTGGLRRTARAFVG